jgi:hypothetical protein
VGVDRLSRSVSIIGDLGQRLNAFLQRTDGQEDICFGLYAPSTGGNRFTAVVQQVLWPGEGDRNVHGNASFNPRYLARALFEASEQNLGIVLMHSHPLGRGWQAMSPPDVRAEQGIAASAYGATSLPLLGMTQAGDLVWSARFWERTGFRQYTKVDCTHVRLVGRRFAVNFYDALIPPPPVTAQQIRTVSAWGDIRQAELARLHIGVVGAGSVGGIVAESLARTGVQRITLIDFDHVEDRNLDRLTYASGGEIGKLKVTCLEEYLNSVATSEAFEVIAVPTSLAEAKAISAALDCDVLFSCVDRPWGRHLLNQISLAHGIPVIDGGIAARTNRSGQLAAADWRTHLLAPGCACIRCLGQYDIGWVQAEREGSLDDPKYIAGLPNGHPLKSRQNVSAFALACASRLLLQFISMVIEPLGHNDFGAEHYHFVGDSWESKRLANCEPDCPVRSVTGAGDLHSIT